MTKKKELRLLGGGRKPKSYRLAHNPVRHCIGFRHGANGFRRFWIPPQWVGKGKGKGWERCPCGWSGRKAHFAIAEHVKHWRKLIKKLGSVQAANDHEADLIGRVMQARLQAAAIGEYSARKAAV